MTAPRLEERRVDVLVVGGGLAATCAAIQAARLGCETLLIERDPVLGGNASPLIGVHPSGAHSFHPYASELGIIGEIIEEAAWQRAKIRTWGQHYNIAQQWDTVLAQKLAEAGVTLLRRTYGRDAETSTLADGRRRIDTVLAEDTARLRALRIEVGTAVIDGSGDGHIAERAGAEYRRGRESRHELGERSAPDQADSITLGSSLTALVRKASAPVEFIPPPGTPPFEPGYGTSRRAVELGRCLLSHSSWHPDGEFCFLWHTETGGHLDTIDDEHAIYDELLHQLYSAWHHIKTEHAEQAANWELCWVAPRPGKRESRRFVGDHLLTQTDVEAGTPFADAVCFGGYSVDIHNPAGKDNSQVEVVFYSVPPLWSMPYRSLFSRNVANLFLAGRLASVSHLGLGSWRLQRTLAAGSQAVGAAAALCLRHDCDSRTLGQQYLAELQQTLLRHDGAMLHLPADDPADLARQANVTATTESRFGVTHADDWLALDLPRGVQLWDWSPRLDAIELYLMNEGDQPVELTLRVEQHTPAQPWKDADHRVGFAYEPVANRMEWGDDNRRTLFEPVAEATASLPAQHVGWIRFELDAELAPPDPTSDEPRVNLLLAPAAGVSWARRRRRVPFARRLWLEPGADAYGSDGDSMLFRLTPAPACGEAANVVNGWNRRFSSNPLNAWQADADAPLPQTLTLAWDAPVEAAQVCLTFDTLTRAYREMPFDCDQRVSPMCVADYRLEATVDGECWEPLAEVRDNYRRRRDHAFEPRRLCGVRLVVERVWDDRTPARVYEVRVYGPGG